MTIKEVTKKDGSTVYRSSVYLGIDSLTGKKVKTTITGRTKKEVKAKAKKAQLDFIHKGQTRKKALTVKSYEELCYLWFDSYRQTVKRNTKESVKGLIMNHLIPAFGAYALDKLTPPIIQNQANQWTKGAFKHYDKLHGLNKRILQYAVVMQLIPYNPAREIILPRKHKTETDKIKFLDHEELKRFIDYLETLDRSNYRLLFDYTLYHFLLATGCRIGEALALEWSDIDFKNKTVSISKTLNHYQELTPPKTKSANRTISIDHATMLKLKQYKNRQQLKAWELGQSPTVVFSSLTSLYATCSALRRRLKNHFSIANISDVSFHGLRHTHATMLLYAGVQPKDLQRRLGHSNISMTLNVYVHATDKGASLVSDFYEKAINSLGD